MGKVWSGELCGLLRNPKHLMFLAKRVQVGELLEMRLERLLGSGHGVLMCALPRVLGISLQGASELLKAVVMGQIYVFVMSLWQQCRRSLRWARLKATSNLDRK